MARLAQEFYGAADACSTLFGFAPQDVHAPGYHHLEETLPSALLEAWRGNFGIYTGRNAAEAQWVLERSGLAPYFPTARRSTTSLGLLKPDPTGLHRLIDSAFVETALFVGETLDDLMTVRRYRTQYPKAPTVILAGLTRGSMGDRSHDIFHRFEADLIAPDVTTLLLAIAQGTRPSP